MLGRRSVSLALLGLSLLTGRAALAGDPAPAAGMQAAKQGDGLPADPAAPPAPPSQFPVHVWELPAIDVYAPGPPRPGLREDDLVGDYKQPRWSAARRFPTTRMYVIPKGKIDFEWWGRYTAPFKDAYKSREFRSFYEFEFGLGHRFQFDVYLVAQQEGAGKIQLAREQLELRYALADWGKIWGNPTLYLEYQHRNDSNDRLEGKILLGGEIARRWHGGFNLVLERELTGKTENEWNLTGGISYTAVDGVFHVGGEAYAEVHDFSGDRWDFGKNEQLYLVGPSFMVSPVAPANILISPLFGAGRSDTGEPIRGVFRLWVIAGWAF